MYAGAGVLAAPLINRGRFSLFAGSLDQYSSLTVDLVRESTVIDMLGLLTLDFKKLDAWRTRPASFRLSDFQRLKDSGITVFHPAVGYVEGDIYAESSADIASWDAFIDSYPQYFIRVCNPADVSRAKAEGKLGIIVGQQNSNHFRTVDDVDAFYRLGQRVSQLTYHDNALGGGSTDPTDRGLTVGGEGSGEDEPARHGSRCLALRRSNHAGCDRGVGEAGSSDALELPRADAAQCPL